MLSYQHGYHAGGFADVIKHVTLTRLLNYLILKDKPLFYLETHAGRGLYDLKDKQALKTGEALDGIQVAWSHRRALPAVFSSYMELISQLNQADTLRYYPGSPIIASTLLRAKDRQFYCELHPQEFEHLKRIPKGGKRVHVSQTDGIKELSALVPPPERRGLIFLDPSYEVKSEYSTIPEALKVAYRRFLTGVYCLWYPLIDDRLHSTLLRRLNVIGAKNHLRLEFYLNNKIGQGMTGTGLWIINPPYLLSAEIKMALESMCQLYNPGVSSFLIED